MRVILLGNATKIARFKSYIGTSIITSINQAAAEDEVTRGGAGTSTATRRAGLPRTETFTATVGFHAIVSPPDAAAITRTEGIATRAYASGILNVDSINLGECTGDQNIAEEELQNGKYDDTLELVTLPVIGRHNLMRFGYIFLNMTGWKIGRRRRPHIKGATDPDPQGEER